MDTKRLLRTLRSASMLLLCAHPVLAQEDIFDLLDTEPTPSEQLVTATFKGTKIINQQSTKLTAKGEFQYIISHRFGALSDDYLYQFFGLDNAQIRMQMDYGLTDRINLGAGRSSDLKVFDTFAKVALLQQRRGPSPIPVSLTWHSSVNYRNQRYTDGIEHEWTDRLSYVHQLLAARKMTSQWSLQMSAGVSHFNLVPGPEDANTMLQIGGATRYKITNRLALTGEYMWSPKNEWSDGSKFYRPLSLGMDAETGGHIFQFHIGNVRSLSDPYWMSQNPYRWNIGQLFFGFNISRVFSP